VNVPFFSRSNPDPEPMTAQDLDDWCASIDAKAQADRKRGVVRENVINARRGKS
jgi:hypothetical protein